MEPKNLKLRIITDGADLRRYKAGLALLPLVTPKTGEWTTAEVRGHLVDPWFPAERMAYPFTPVLLIHRPAIPPVGESRPVWIVSEPTTGAMISRELYYSLPDAVTLGKSTLKQLVGVWSDYMTPAEVVEKWNGSIRKAAARLAEAGLPCPANVWDGQDGVQVF